MHQVTRGDRLSCYLPPPLQQPSLLGHVFTKVFAEDCHSLFSGEDQPEYRASQVRQLTYQYTCPASVLHAASLAGLPGGPVSSVSSLVIHLVGARSVEVEQAPAWTLLPARLPNLTSVTLVMVGPELGGDNLPTSFSLKANNAVVKFSLVKSDYLQYSRSKHYTEPDLVAALNCGFIFYKSWDSSLDSMLRRSSAPLVFTEYYLQVITSSQLSSVLTLPLQDCQLNLEKIIQNTKKKVKVVLEPSANPFCSRFVKTQFGGFYKSISTFCIFSFPARIPAGFGLRKYGRKNILMSNDFICIVKNENKKQ